MIARHRTPTLSLVVDQPLGPGTRHGLGKLRKALQSGKVIFEEVNGLQASQGQTLLVLGTAESTVVQTLTNPLGIALPQPAEALRIEVSNWKGRPTYLVIGADDRGLMYALLDIASRITWADDPDFPLSEVHAILEAPAVAERSLSIYTMHKSDFERRFFNAAYWTQYLDMLAENRFNTFALLFAYENAGYLAPPYPYFLTVDDFPEVEVVGWTPSLQQRYRDGLNHLIAMAHKRGLAFTLGIWDHIYRGGVQTGGVEADHEATLPWRVTGLTADNLVDYSAAALKEFLHQVPNLDTLQFRMHGESGLTEAEMDRFWAQIYDIIVTEAPQLRLDARAKGFPDHLIDLAIQKGINLRVCTKYWMEQMGPPFHPTHIHPQNQHDRRHSYADLLQYPQRYRILWRLWNGGTSRILLWGDPDYVRRFVDSTQLYNGDGFDVNEPLATKMAAQDHDAEPFELLTADHRYYEWEFERYWHFYQLFGRLGYNPESSAEIWERTFAARYGQRAAPYVARGLHLASRILPRVVAYSYPYHLFPTTRGWVEKQRMGDLPTYAAALPSDTQQFLSIAQEAQNQLEGGESAKIRPQTSSIWFERIADEVLQQVAQAEASAEDTTDRELIATLTDMRILAHLARFHALRAQAGVHYALFEQSQELHALDDAIAWEARAVAAWEALVAAAGSVYTDSIRMGLESAGLTGHWSDELTALGQGLAQLKALRDAYHPPKGHGVWLAHVPIRRTAPGSEIIVHATAASDIETEGAPSVRVCYTPDESDVTCTALTSTDGLRYAGSIPASAVKPGLRYRLEVVDGANRRTQTPREECGWIPVIVTDDNAPPQIAHTPITTALPGEPLSISATVRNATGVKWVRLRYRSVTQLQDYQMLPMLPTDEPDTYRAVVPAVALNPRWDFMYLIEALDNSGNSALFPDLEIQQPYIVVRLSPEGEP